MSRGKTTVKASLASLIKKKNKKRAQSSKIYYVFFNKILGLL